MKLSLNMDSKLPETVTETREEKKGRSVSIKWAVFGLVTVIVVALIVSLSIYFGMKAAKDTYKEAWQTYKSQNGKVVEEKVTVSENTVDVKVPNEMEIVYDYNHGLKVWRYIGHQAGGYGPCYATYINDSLASIPQDVMDNLEDGEITLAREKNVTKMHVKLTENQVPYYMLSDEVKAMCHDTEVYWTESNPSGERMRRDTCAVIIYTWACIPYPPYIALCEECAHCYNATGVYESSICLYYLYY